MILSVFSRSRNYKSVCAILSPRTTTNHCLQLPNYHRHQPSAFNSNCPHKVLYEMKQVYFRYQPDALQFQMNFLYTDEAYGINRIFNFSRSTTESVDSCMNRIKTNVEKEYGKIVKKRNDKAYKSAKKAEKLRKEMELKGGEAMLQMEQPKDTFTIPQPDITASLYRGDTLLSGIYMNEIFTEGRESCSDLRLVIGDQNFQVKYNIPWINALTLPNRLVAGCYVMPEKLDMDFGNREESKYEWYQKAIDAHEWNLVGDKYYYKLPQLEILDMIKLICTPRSGHLIGPPVECISDGQLECHNRPAENRHQYTQQPLNGRQFRVVTYNLLADLYADSDYSRTQLFPYCKPTYLEIAYRKALFITELIQYHTDIMCLQEVDRKIFEYDFQSMFSTLSFDGTYQQKGTSAEGLATFYNTTRFSLVHAYGINIGEQLPKLAIFADIWAKIRENGRLATRICERSTAVQVTVMKSRDCSNYLLVANTHLYFHPDSDNIRLLQMGLAMKYVEYVYTKTRNDLHLDGDSDLSIVFCGDFNSVPECGIYALMTQKVVPSSFIDFSSNKEEALDTVELRQPFNIDSAYKDIEYTNFTVDFAACIDYIFYQTDKLRVVQVVPPPSKQELELCKAIPSMYYPSDHISLVADFEWT